MSQETKKSTKKDSTVNATGMWEQFTEWSLQNVVNQVRGYFKDVPHLSEGIRSGLTSLIIVLYKIGLILGIIVLLPAPLYLFAGLHGILTLAYLLIVEIFGWKVKGYIESRSAKGWEYLAAFVVLGLAYSAASLVLSLISGYGMSIMSNLLGLILGAIIEFYLLFEIESEFKK